MNKPNPPHCPHRIVTGLAIMALLASASALLMVGCTARKGLDKTTNLFRYPASPGPPSETSLRPEPGRRNFQTSVGTLPSLDEEVWDIARSRTRPTSPDDSPGSGSLWTQREEKEVAVPLKHTEVKASIDGFIATVKVVQQFQNPYDSKIEAVYVFPLPE